MGVTIGYNKLSLLILLSYF